MLPKDRCRLTFDFSAQGLLKLLRVSTWPRPNISGTMAETAAPIMTVSSGAAPIMTFPAGTAAPIMTTGAMPAYSPITTTGAPIMTSSAAAAAPIVSSYGGYSGYGGYSIPSALDHSQGKWFMPGEALPPGYVVTVHPEGHSAPQADHSMSDMARESFVVTTGTAVKASASSALKKSKKSKMLGAKEKPGGPHQ